MTPTELAALEATKHASTLQLLMRCARLVNGRALERMRQHYGQPSLRAAHTALFPHLDMTGTRLTVLAERVGISKQAVGQLVTELEEMGALERVPDPSDGRAKLICFKGDELMAGLTMLLTLEQELVETAGAAELSGLRAGLLAVLGVVDPKDPIGE